MNQPLYKIVNQNDPLAIYGYKIVSHNKKDLFPSVKKEFENYISRSMTDFNPDIDLDGFKLENFHKILEKNKISHHDFISSISRDVSNIFLEHPFFLQLLEDAFEATGLKFQIYKNKIELRVVRPHNEDNNSLHRDHWFPYFTPLMNVYLPICGSNYDSAMCVVPFSHKWEESDVTPTFSFEESQKGAKTIKNGVAYSVPEIKESKKEIIPHRPDIVYGDFMLFSPLMVHGGGTNSSIDTRFSFEFRLEQVE